MDVENLVRLSKAGCKESFEKLFIIYSKDLYFQALILLKNPEDAADAVQDTALQAFRYIQDLKNDKYFKTWTTRILINRCNKLRSIIHKYEHVNLMECHIWSEPLIESEIELLDVLDALDEKSKTIISLRFISDLNISEISSVLNISEGTVKSRLNRSIKKLKNILEEGGSYE